MIAGLAQRTTTLTSATGTWTGNGNTYSGQWQRSADGTTWTDIAGATGPTYKLTVADEGSQVRLLVTAVNPDGSVSAASTPSASVTGGAPVNTAAPAMTGSPQRGSVLTATPGAWSGLENTYAFQWQRSADGSTWTDISGETSPSHVIGIADEGNSLRVAVTATNADGTATASGAATAVIPSSPPTNTVAPTVTGTAQRTFTLTATQGTWAGIGNTYTYQWQHDTGSGYVDIVGQTGTTYGSWRAGRGHDRPRADHRDQRRRNGDEGERADGDRARGRPAQHGRPTLTGTPQRGLLLTGTLGTWDGIGNAYAYQWQRSLDGTTWTTITGATNPTYTLTVADEGAQVRVQVTATNVDGSAISSSPATVAVTGGAPVNLTPPTFAGAPQRAVRLAVTSNGNWAGIGNMLTRQWQRSADGGQTWTNIVGQTDGSYTLTVADEGARGPAARHRDQRRRRHWRGERPERDGGLRAGAQHDAARRHRDAAAERHPDRHPGHLVWPGQHLRLPVAAQHRPRRELVEDHRRDHLCLPRARRRRRRDRPRAGHGEQRGRDRHGVQPGDLRDPGRPAGQSHAARRDRDPTANDDADCHSGHVVRRRQHLHLPVAALHRPGRDVDADRRGERRQLHAPDRGRERQHPHRHHRQQPGRWSQLTESGHTGGRSLRLR